MKSKIKESKIEQIHVFTVDEWRKNPNSILNFISKSFKHKKIIIRSSAIGEDSIESSQAGNYRSILDVDSQNISEIKKSIKKVIQSYKKKGNNNPSNQILIQKQVTNSILSGVIFSRTPENGAPYFVINYTIGSSTDTVTKGLKTQTLKIYRNIKKSEIPAKWKKLLLAVMEIEKIFKNNMLDIEFAITKNSIIIFQVRPITSIPAFNFKEIDKKFSKLISNNKKTFSKLNDSNLFYGNSTKFSDMTDWNPSEIIGNNPNRLDYSLYDYLIMNDSWQKGRSKIGYHNVGKASLMVQFGNKPYVDVRASFNSLLPKNIHANLKKKLINYYLKKLSANPFLHDKAEFEILFSCFDLTIDSRLKELKNFNFSTKEINQIKNSLLILTNNILYDFPIINNNCKKSIQTMLINRNEIKKQLKTKPKSPKILLNFAEQLLKDCKTFGTTPFSTMARISFISSILLRSAEKEKIITPKFIENFMNSISTPLSKFQNDFILFSEKKITKSSFLQKYGHLRPGTYDITALRYDSHNPYFDEFKISKNKTSKKIIVDKNLTKIFSQNGIIFNKVNFLDFVTNSIIQRENLKFEFTKNLSDALELIAEAGSLLGFNRKQLSNLSIKTILKTKNLSNVSIQKFWNNSIETEKQNRSINDFLSLPSLLFSKHDFDITQYYISKPNYITSKKIQSKIVRLKPHDERIPILKNKIVLIENADPGYDWIFTKKPLGLITKYGGVASHMSIRCAEIGLPASIGCGDIIFEKLNNSSEILLDCKNQQIVILEYKTDDQEIEVNKTLRYLGYIT
ncbi:PEP/pyruvate-binding domain-containing protein [Nitrosopumilus sp.]|uniref:PEP/pyruvate-binding domain-containing protein n=1 Tax=Nitrosopumilus sp. TaxID=2024843 RepID=UPI003D13D83B